MLADRDGGRGDTVSQIGDYAFEVGALTREMSDAYEKLVRN